MRHFRAPPARIASRRTPRADIELDNEALAITHSSGRWQLLPLCRTQFHSRRATLNNHIVRQLIIQCGPERADTITPPEEGLLETPADELPEVLGEPAILESERWSLLCRWLVNRRSVTVFTLDELAQLACMASTEYAMIIGRTFAYRALESTWQQHGPMRTSGWSQTPLLALERMALTSPRASAVLVAARIEVTRLQSDMRRASSTRAS